MNLGRDKKGVVKKEAKEDLSSAGLRSVIRAGKITMEEVEVRLNPWRDLSGIRSLPISSQELDSAVRLIDPETCAEGAPAAITAGARPRYWSKITPAKMKAALVAAMLVHEGLNRMSKLRESNAFNLPTGDLLINVLESSVFDADTKGLAVLLMLKQPIGTRCVEALRLINSSPDQSEFLAASLGVASRKLNNALKVIAA